MLKFIKPYFSIINGVVIAGLLVIHFVLGEINYFWSLLFYTFPIPVIILAIVLFSLFLTKKYRTYNIILVLILLVIWFGRSFKINSPENIIETDIEVVFWNATHKREFKDVFDEGATLPDIVVLVEYHAEALEETKLMYPNNFFYWDSDSEIGIFSKKQIQFESVFTSDKNTVVLNFLTNGLNFYAVDVSSTLQVPREKELAFVDRLIQKNKNSIIIGDFNVPYDSKFLNTIKSNFNHAFTEKGNGFIETWFWNIPLLSLDHIWVSKEIKILKTEKINTFKSDHNMIKTFIRI